PAASLLLRRVRVPKQAIAHAPFARALPLQPAPSPLVTDVPALLVFVVLPPELSLPGATVRVRPVFAVLLPRLWLQPRAFLLQPVCVFQLQPQLSLVTTAPAQTAAVWPLRRRRASTSAARGSTARWGRYAFPCLWSSGSIAVWSLELRPAAEQSPRMSARVS